MYKFIGDSILNASFTVQVPKPLDNRTVVANIYELYSIPPAYAYEGMTVANIDNGNIYMLVNKSKIGEKAGWKASYESIQIIACELNEYKEWKANTDNLFQPIDPLKEYLHQDTYYYIYEDSLDGQEELQEYVRRSDWMELLNEVTNSRATMGQLISAIRAEYASLEYANNTFAPLTMFDTDDPESYISELIANYYTKEEADEKFVTIESLQDDENFIFVTNERYSEDQEALAQYQQDTAEQLTHFVVTDSNASLNSLVVGRILSPVAGGRQLVIDVTADGLKAGDERYAFISDIPNLITVTKAEYEQLVANDELIDDAYYYITGEEESYVLRSELEAGYYNKNSVEGLVYNWSYSKEAIDQLLADIETGSSDIYFSKEYIRENYVDNDELATALLDYVTISMIKTNDEYIFITKSAYQQDLADRDLLIDSTYVKKDSDASLNSLETSTIKNGQNVLSITDLLTLNSKKLAFEEDVPKLITLTKAEYLALIANDELDLDAYYHITDDSDTYVLASQLVDYYTKTGVESYVAGRTYSKAEVDELIARLSGYYTRDDIDDLFVSSNALQEILEDYVTIEMLTDPEGDYYFVKASDYESDQQALAQLRQDDLLQINTDFVKKDSDASLNSLETSTIKNGLNTLLLTDVLKLNNKKLALDEDIPVIQVVSDAEFENLVKDPDVFYFVYNTNLNLAFVTAEELTYYYTKAQMNQKLLEITENQFSGDYEDLTNKPELFSGDYEDLTNKPTIPTIPTNISVFVNDAGYLTQHQSLATLFDDVAYDSQTKRINFKHGDTVLAYIDATDFIKDGMVSDVQIVNGKLTISFNTDSGQSPIEIPITDIFNPNNYYTKEQIDTALQSKVDKSAIGDLGNISEAIPAVEPVEAQPAIYSFESWNNSSKETKYGEGTVKVIEMRADGATVEVVTNSPNQSFVGQQFNIATALATDEPIQLYTLEDEPIDIWVTVELVSEAVEPVEGQEGVPAVPHTVKSYVDLVALGGIRLVKITQSAYTALEVKDPNTLYIVTED